MAAIHLAWLRQFNGVTYLVVYASQIPIHQETSLGSAASVITNSIQWVGGLLGIAAVTFLKRYKMISISTVVLLFLNITNGLSSLYNLPSLGFVSICIFMLICSTFLTSVAWTYNAELATPGM